MNVQIQTTKEVKEENFLLQRLRSIQNSLTDMHEKWKMLHFAL